MPSSKLREESPRVPANERALFSAKIGERTHETRVSLLQKLNGNVRANFLQRELFRPEREAQREAEEGAAKIHARREGWEHAEASPPPARGRSYRALRLHNVSPRYCASRLRVSSGRSGKQGSINFQLQPGRLQFSSSCISAGHATPHLTHDRLLYDREAADRARGGLSQLLPLVESTWSVA
jgi:hypothetical protein